MIQGPICPYCGSHSALCDAESVYGPKFAGKFNMWVCTQYPECDSYVGVHKDQAEPKPLGTMANAELRGLRKRVHALFDPLWKSGPLRRFKGPKARKEAYWWLTDKMGIAEGQFHTAEANEDQCRRALAVLIHSGDEETETNCQTS